MAGRQKQNPSRESQALRNLFAQALSGKDLKTIELGTGVSAKSLAWLLAGEDAGTSLRPDRKAKADKGQKLFRARAYQLAQAAKFVKESSTELVRQHPAIVDLQKLGAAFGLLTPGQDQQLRAIVEEVFRAEQHELGRPKGFDGPIIEDMRQRAARPQTRIETPEVEALAKIGLVVWDPIHWSQGAGRKNNSGHRGPEECSFGANISQRLIGALGPRWALEPIEDITGFDVALDRIIKQPLECHFVCGLYETTARFAAGVEFIHFPGLKAQSAVLARIDDFRGNEKWTWPSILEPSFRPPHLRRHRGVVAIVLRDEASHTLLRGACLYGQKVRPFPAEIQLVVSENDSDAEDLYRNAAQALLVVSKDLQVVPYFMADAVSSIRVARHLLALSKNHQGSPAEISVDKNSLESIGFKFLQFDKDNTPTYSIGIAVRRDAGPFIDLLKRAFNDDLLGNNISGLAHAYIQLAERAIEPPSGPSVMNGKDPRKFAESVSPENDWNPQYLPVSFDHKPPASSQESVDRIKGSVAKLIDSYPDIRNRTDVKRWFGI